jgi:phage terminase large subunit-like protein
MIEDLTRAEYEAVLRQDFTTFVTRCAWGVNGKHLFLIGLFRRRLALKRAVREQQNLFNASVVRMHAQTAVIENGFVHIPETAPWLAEYLHELGP